MNLHGAPHVVTLQNGHYRIAMLLAEVVSKNILKGLPKMIISKPDLLCEKKSWVSLKFYVNSQTWDSNFHLYFSISEAY